MSYIDDIHRIDNLTINEIIRISNKYVPNRYKLEPWRYMDGQGRTLEHWHCSLRNRRAVLCLHVCIWTYASS